MYNRIAAVVLLLCFWAAAMPAMAQEGVVAHWDFDEGQGDVLHDRSGDGNDGKIHGAQWVKVGGGHALKFDGVDDCVDCGTGPSLDITGSITLEAWVYPESVPSPEAGIVGKFYSSYALTQSGRAVWWYISSGANHLHHELRIGEWQHVGATFDGTTMRIYVNGRPVEVRQSKLNTLNKGKNFLMGCVVGDPTATDPAYHETSHFKGMIDDVRVHARILSEKELASHYNESARKRGKEPVDTSWFDRFKLTPYVYLDRNELVVKVDFRGLLPIPEGAQVTAEFARTGEAEPLQVREIETSLQPGYIEVTFPLPDLAPGDYDIRAVLKDKTGVKSAETLAFRYPPALPGVPSPAEKLVGPLPKELDKQPFGLELCAGGGFRIVCQGEAYPVDSTFSYPQGGKNALLASAEKGTESEPSWTVTTEQAGATEYRVMARGDYYAIERKIARRPECVTVTDMITNLKDEDVGIIINNGIDTGERSFPTCYLGGVEGRGEQEAIHNPTAFVARPGLGFGLVAVDDVYVVHGSLYSKEKAATGVRDDMFGLGPKASYTVTWSIYPVASDDYFDFINVVRNDLGLNGQTVDAPLTYINRKEPVPETLLNELQSKYICLGCLAWSADDPGISIEGIEFIDFPKERAHVKKVFAEIRAKYPDAWPMFHVAHSLYATNEPERYADSRVVDEKGKQAVWSAARPYLEQYFSKENLDAGWNWYIFYPTTDNSFGKAMLYAVDVMMDEMGSKGVFADGLMAGYAGRFTYDRWDNHTVRIDPETKTIRKKFASVHLLSQELLLQYCRKIVGKGGVVLVDSGPGTLTFAREAPAAAYPMETGVVNSFRWVHLAPFPTALPWPAWNPKPSIYQDILKKLRLGLLWYDYYLKVGGSSIFSRFYPITIEEIHPGFIKGKKKLVTALSGVYGWQGDEDIHFVDLSDGRGILVPHQFLTTVDAAGVRTQLDLGEDEIAVLKKIPVTIQSRKPINVIVQQYDAQGIRLTLNGNSDIQISVRDGVFHVEPGATYSVAETPTTALAEPNGIVRFPVRLNGQLAVRIQAAPR